MPGAVPLSVVVITKNEEERLRECLESVSWAEELLVVDDESTDRTVAVAMEKGARVIRRKMEVEGRHRNFAYAQARHEWVLSLDADERVTPALREEILSLLQRGPDRDGYTMPRRNYIGRRWVRHGGWYPSPQLRLFKKGAFKYEEVEVHPRAFMSSPSGQLKHDLIHYSYRDLGDFLAKLNRQTTLEAQKWVKDGRRMKLGRGLWRTVDRFFRTWWMKKGYRDGFLGFAVAVYAGFYQFLSYAKYWHLKTIPQVVPAPSPQAAQPAAAKQVPGDRPKPLAGRQRISAVIITKNAIATIQPCLSSLKWVDEIVVVDGGSTDGTQQKALLAGAKVVMDARSDDFGGLRNLGTDCSRGDWVLQLDADEVVTPDFREKIEEILAHPDSHAAYKFRRRNKFLGRWMRYGGWDHHSLHLFRRGRARYEGRVHERLNVEGSVGTLDVGVEHTPFRSLEEFVDRQNRYTTLEARELVEKNPNLSPREIRYQATLRPAKLFWKLYVKKQGFREGRVGFLFCALYSFVHFLKWAKCWEMKEPAA